MAYGLTAAAAAKGLAPEADDCHVPLAILTSRAHSMQTAKALIVEQSVVARAQETLKTLKNRGVSVVTAESCTGGLLAAVLSGCDGAGDVLHGGFVTYSKDHKAEALGVSAALLKEKGAVNAEVVQQLAEGALVRSPASVAIAVSGVLGPEPDEDGNPVGLVYFGACKRGAAPRIVRETFGQQPREVLLQKTIGRALDLIAEIASS